MPVAWSHQTLTKTTTPGDGVCVRLNASTVLGAPAKACVNV